MPIEVRYYLWEFIPLGRRTLDKGESITIPSSRRGDKKQTVTAKANGVVEVSDSNSTEGKLQNVQSQPITRFGRFLTVEITSGQYH